MQTAGRVLGRPFWAGSRLSLRYAWMSATRTKPTLDYLLQRAALFVLQVQLKNSRREADFSSGYETIGELLLN